MKTDQAKPTGEWTPAFVMEVREGCEIAGVDFDTKIANGHNAALAAEREKWDKLADEPLTHAIRKADIEIQQLRSQVQTLVDALKALHADIAQYARMNNLVGFDSNVMKESRAALAKVKEGQE